MLRGEERAAQAVRVEERVVRFEGWVVVAVAVVMVLTAGVVAWAEVVFVAGVEGVVERAARCRPSRERVGGEKVRAEGIRRIRAR